MLGFRFTPRLIDISYVKLYSFNKPSYYPKLEKIIKDNYDDVLKLAHSIQEEKVSQKGLNKGEAANALARAIFFAKRGEFHERDLQDQMQRASILNILMNAITVWNTVYLGKVIEYLRERNELNEDLLSRVLLPAPR